MIAPGFSSDRIPGQLRLYLSIGISILITPLEVGRLPDDFTAGEKPQILFVITHELMVGLTIGLLGRIFLFALESLMTAFSLTIGLTNIFDTGVFDTGSAPVLSTFIILATIQLILGADLHHYFIQELDRSFAIAPIASKINLSGIVHEITMILSQSYLIALRITSPFIIFATIINLSFGFLARLSPQMPIYFISGPVVILLGFYFFYFVSVDFLSAFIASFKNFLAGG